VQSSKSEQLNWRSNPTKAWHRQPEISASMNIPYLPGYPSIIRERVAHLVSSILNISMMNSRAYRKKMRCERRNVIS